MENNAQFQIIFYRESSSSNIYQEMNNEFAQDYCSNVHLVSTPIELSTYLKKHNNILLVMRIKNSIEVKEVSAILKKYRKKVKSSGIKPMAIMNEMSANDKMLLQNVGCQALYPKTVKVERIVDDAKKWLFVLETKLEAEQKKNMATGTLEPKPESQIVKSLAQNEDDQAQVIGQIEQSEAVQINLEEGELEVSYSTNNSENTPCRLEFFSDSEVEIEVENNFAAISNMKMTINILFIYQKCRIELQVDGVVLEAEQLPNGKQLVVLESKTDQMLIESFMELYQRRQKSVHDYMQLAKGY